jgi:integrase
MARREYQKPNVLRQDGARPYWYLRYRVRVYNEQKKRFERTEKWQRLGYCDEMTKREAERARDNLVVEVNNQVFTLRDQIPCRDFVTRYQRDFMPNLGLGTQRKYTSLFDTHLLPAFGSLRLCDLTTQRLQTFLTDKRKDGLSWWSRSDLRNLLSGLFTCAVGWKYWFKPNPVVGTEIGEKEWKWNNRSLTDDEVKKVIEALAPGSQVRLIVEMLVVTGMRTSEIFGLKWKYVDLDRGVIEVRERNYRGEQGSPKTRSSRRDLPVGVLIEQYKALKPVEVPPDAFVFHEEGQPLDERSVLRYQLRPVAKALQLYFDGFRWHTFRRTHLTALSEEGATAFETRDQAGHAKVETTMLYVKPSLVRRGAAVERVTGRLLPADCAGIVREKRTDAFHLDAYLSNLLNDLMVGPTELESVTSTVSR